jgi:hypothetical protein
MLPIIFDPYLGFYPGFDILLGRIAIGEAKQGKARQGQGKVRGDKGMGKM